MKHLTRLMAASRAVNWQRYERVQPTDLFLNYQGQYVPIGKFYPDFVGTLTSSLNFPVIKTCESNHEQLFI
jgi:hypothetical protein